MILKLIKNWINGIVDERMLHNNTPTISIVDEFTELDGLDDLDFELSLDDELFLDDDLELSLDDCFDDLDIDLFLDDDLSDDLDDLPITGLQNMQVLKRDITTIERGIIAHGVNCQRAMGSGVALALLNKWALVREQYMTQGKGKSMLGTIDEVVVDPNISVFNCYTQEYFGREGKRYASPAAICVALMNVADIACERDVPMYIPLIGCQLGGLSVEQDLIPILEQIELMYEDIDLNICVI